MFGPSEIGIIKQNLSNNQYVEQAIEDYYDFYNMGHSELVKHNEKILNMINELKRKGILLGIVTGKARRSYEISINHLFSSDPFEVSITGDDVIYPKPHPEGVTKAIKLLNSTVDEALFIGDSDAEIKAGIDVGVTTVGVNWLDKKQRLVFCGKSTYLGVQPYGRTKGLSIIQSSYQMMKVI
jgi:pyrophosphatase PpaX